MGQGSGTMYYVVPPTKQSFRCLTVQIWPQVLDHAKI